MKESEPRGAAEISGLMWWAALENLAAQWPEVLATRLEQVEQKGINP
ncbi:MAG: hypothetical protein MUE94_06600 [Verrucomicrobia bacterium]|jgi:hypothetical protein|nr:hypothetical protein [Verrucomicrobiota bacterium]